MANAKITKKPNGKITSLGTPTREGNGSRVITAKWKVPSACTKGSNARRFTNLDVWWWVGMSDREAQRHTTRGTGTTSQNIDLNGLDADYIWWTRGSFYPYTGTRVNYVKVGVRGKNNKGVGPWVYASCNFSPPRAPSVSALTQNGDTGVVSCTVKTDAGNDYQERADTRIQVVITDSRRGTWVSQDFCTGATDVTVSQDVPDRMQLAYGQYIHVKVRACARGLAGDSWWSEQAITVSYPALATIRGVDVTSKSASDKVTVRLSTNNVWHQPVTGVRLQKLVSCDYQNAQSIPASAGWDNTNIVDNGECSALSVGVADLLPDPGKYTWVRVKTWNQHEGLFYRYTAPVRVSKLETPLPTAADDAVELASLAPGTDGRSAVAVMGWDKNGTDDSQLTQLTWSDDQNAWRSTDAPKDFEFDWSDGPATLGGVSYRKSATVHIRGLDEGKKYYVRARRHMTGEHESYGPWSKTLDVIPTTAPSSVALKAPSFVPRGSSVELAWSFDGGSTQTGWQVMSGGSVVARGTDALGTCVLDAERVATLADGADSITLSVSVSTGGQWVSSEAVAVGLADPPTVSVDVGATTVSQPLELGVTASSACSLVVVVSALGAQGDWPDGERTQPEGDCVWSDVVDPEWEDDGEGNLVATVSAPTGLDLWDKARYAVSVTATDPSTSLSSAPASAVTEVAWSHQAPMPSEEIAVVPSDATDEDGNRSLSCAVLLAAPTGAATGDVYDLYRVTADGPYAIALGVAPGSEVTDEWAPYGGSGLLYRVACRTADGDVDWADYPYSLDASELRVDFGGEYVELPYDIAVSDGYEKDFEARRHLDGSVDGYWNRGARRRAKISTNLVRVQGEGARAVRELARHDGPCFVRTPDGCAYMADVQVGGLDVSCTSAAVTVSIDATEVALTPEYQATLPLPDDAEEAVP